MVNTTFLIDMKIKVDRDAPLSALGRRLSNVRRMSRTRLIHPQTVAEHSFNVAVMALEVVDSGCDWSRGLKYTFVRAALTHDLEEALTGDICYDVKTNLNLPARGLLEVVKKITAFDGDTLALRLDYAAHRMPTGQLLALRFLDMFELFLFLSEEEDNGNKSSDIRAVQTRATDVLHKLGMELIAEAHGHEVHDDPPDPEISPREPFSIPFTMRPWILHFVPRAAGDSALKI